MTIPMTRVDDEEIVTLNEAKLWLRIDHDEEDELIAMLIEGARQYLIGATGREWSRKSVTARQVMLALIADNYVHRDTNVGRGSTKDLRPAIQSMIAQLQYEPPLDGDES